MATVTGLTAEKTMALLAEKANIGHVHAPSGGGSAGPHLAHAFGVDQFTYLDRPGEGTEMKVAHLFEHPSNSYSANGVLGVPDPPLLYVQESEQRLYVRTPGVYQVRVHWYIEFPNSVPTSFASFINGREMDPPASQYHPIGPSRPRTFVIEGHYTNKPHVAGEYISHPLYYEEDWWICDVALWWNTQDVNVDGGTYPVGDPGSPIPTLGIQAIKVG